MFELLLGIRRLFQNGALPTIFAICLSSFAHADLVLTFDTETSIQSKSDSDSTLSVKKSNLTILLGGSYFHFTSEEGEGIYDFNSKKIYTLKRHKGIYSVMSLFANVGFRDYELRNRKFLSGVLDKAGLKDNPIPLIFSEHELSVQEKKSKPKIDRVERNGHILFLGSGKEMLMIGGAIISIPEKYKKQFIRLFRYRFGGHPSIIGEIVTSSGIYEDITISHINVREKKIKLHLNSIKEIPTADYSLKGLEVYTEADNGLLKLVNRIGDAPIDERKKNESRILANASILIEKNNLIGGMLAYLEYSLVTGSQDIPWTKIDRERLLNSDDVKKMLAATQNPKNQEEAISRIGALENLRKNQNEGSHILTIFEANTRAKAGESKAAKDLMMAALETNPYIAGAWKDLGEFYFRSYEHNEAWICWDTARRINPSHPLLDGVTGFEKQLQVKHPGFF